eukprot:Gb_18777 [translate_table: standard]
MDMHSCIAYSRVDTMPSIKQWHRNLLFVDCSTIPLPPWIVEFERRMESSHHGLCSSSASFRNRNAVKYRLKSEMFCAEFFTEFDNRLANVFFCVNFGSEVEN